MELSPTESDARSVGLPPTPKCLWNGLLCVWRWGIKCVVWPPERVHGLFISRGTKMFSVWMWYASLRKCLSYGEINCPFVRVTGDVSLYLEWEENTFSYLCYTQRCLFFLLFSLLKGNVSTAVERNVSGPLVWRNVPLTSWQGGAWLDWSSDGTVRFFLPLVRGNDSIDSSVPEGAVSAYDSKSICSNQTTVSVFVWTAKTQQTTVNIHAWTVKTWVFTHEQ